MKDLLKSSILQKCPGFYCGRTILPSGNLTECGACPRGFRTNVTSICTPCNDSPILYDYLYLGFIALFTLVLHWFCIYSVITRRIQKEIVIFLSALTETALAALVTLLLTEPMGTFYIKSCRVLRLSDWYTLFYNPSLNYETSLACTQEAVYPLYTMAFIFYFLVVVFMLVLRIYVVKRILPNEGRLTIYATLYFVPILAATHAVGSGLIYYTFPYIAIILTALSNAMHMAFKLKQTIKFLFTSSIWDFKNVIILTIHWLLTGYGVVALAILKGVNVHFAMFLLIPLPTILYIFSANFTDPHKLNFELTN